MSNPVRFIIVFAAFIAVELILRRANLRKDFRGRQVLMIYLSPVIA